MVLSTGALLPVVLSLAELHTTVPIWDRCLMCLRPMAMNAEKCGIQDRIECRWVLTLVALSYAVLLTI